MFGYRAQQVLELKPEDVDGSPVPRTKSRAYKLAVMIGPTGLQWDYLGHPVVGWGWWLAVRLPILGVLLYGFLGPYAADDLPWWVVIGPAVWVVGIWLAAILLIIRIPEDSPTFTGETSDWFFPLNPLRLGVMARNYNEGEYWARVTDRGAPEFHNLG